MLSVMVYASSPLHGSLSLPESFPHMVSLSSMCRLLQGLRHECVGLAGVSIRHGLSTSSLNVLRQSKSQE